MNGSQIADPMTDATRGVSAGGAAAGQDSNPDHNPRQNDLTISDGFLTTSRFTSHNHASQTESRHARKPAESTIGAQCVTRKPDGGGGGIRTHGRFPDSGFQDRRNRPLYHPSKLFIISSLRLCYYLQMMPDSYHYWAAKPHNSMNQEPTQWEATGTPGLYVRQPGGGF